MVLPQTVQLLKSLPNTENQLSICSIPPTNHHLLQFPFIPFSLTPFSFTPFSTPTWESLYQHRSTSKIFPPNLPTFSPSQVGFVSLLDSDSKAHWADYLIQAFSTSSFWPFPPSTLFQSNSVHLASAPRLLGRSRLIHDCASFSFLPFKSQAGPKRCLTILPHFSGQFTLLISETPILLFLLSSNLQYPPASTLTRWLTHFLFHKQQGS